jgi:two-component system response regulator YesN
MIKSIVIEDEPAVRRELALLTPWDELGIVFSGEASNGTEGLELAVRVQPDIVITDIRMPGMDGLAFLAEWDARCRASGRSMGECIILSGYSEFEYARTAMRLGVSEYLLKPVADEDLRAALIRARDRIMDNSERAKTERMFFKEYDASQDRGPYADHVEGAVRIIHDRYISGVTIEEAAAALGISSGHLSRIFRQETGYTFLDYLMYVRVKRAAELLRDPTVKVYEVADLVGYADARYFGQVFRKITGLTPREFRDGLSHTERTSGQE